MDSGPPKLKTPNLTDSQIFTFVVDTQSKPKSEIIVAKMQINLSIG